MFVLSVSPKFMLHALGPGEFAWLCSCVGVSVWLGWVVVLLSEEDLCVYKRSGVVLLLLPNAIHHSWNRRGLHYPKPTI